MGDQLEWERISEKRFEAIDGIIRYVVAGRARRDFNDEIVVVWHAKMNGVPIGNRGGFESARAAMEYVDWGGTPNRMGFDRETGEAQ